MHISVNTREEGGPAEASVMKGLVCGTRAIMCHSTCPALEPQCLADQGWASSIVGKNAR